MAECLGGPDCDLEGVFGDEGGQVVVGWCGLVVHGDGEGGEIYGVCIDFDDG